MDMEMLEQAREQATKLKNRILNFEIKRWIDMPWYMRQAYRKELYEILREAGWYICDAEAHLYTIDDMNNHMQRAQRLIRKYDKYTWE